MAGTGRRSGTNAAAEIETKAALFDEAEYQGGIASDLFGEQRYFTEPDAFWRLQNAAIAAERERLIAVGWADVHVIAPDQRFRPWEFDKVPKARGGAVYIDVEADGHVTVHKGLLPRAGAVRKTQRRPEMSAPLANAVDLVRHSAVRLAVARAPKIALRLALAHMIGGSKLWQVAAEAQTPHNETIAHWRDALPTQAMFDTLRRAAIARLGLDGAMLIDRDSSGVRTASIFAQLMDWSDQDVLALLAVVMADALALGTGLIDTLATGLDVDVGQHGQPDDVFFDLVKEREAITAMLADVIGETAAASYLTETGTKKKAILRKALAGHGRTKVEGWLPRFMRCPQTGYTGRPLTAATRSMA